jgi:hypothetical protein
MAAQPPEGAGNKAASSRLAGAGSLPAAMSGSSRDKMPSLTPQALQRAWFVGSAPAPDRVRRAICRGGARCRQARIVGAVGWCFCAEASGAVYRARKRSYTTVSGATASSLRRLHTRPQAIAALPPAMFIGNRIRGGSRITASTERSAAWLAHQSGGLGVGSSNLPAPTK